MSTVPHPAEFISSSLLSTLRDHAAEAETLIALHPAQLDLIYRQGWFKMLVPKRHGGLGLSLPDVVKIEEGLAWADGSTAWVVTLCAGAGWFVGFLDPALSQDLIADEKVCLAGSGAATGSAEIVDDGYIINGEWKYASGALHATAFTANCIITKNNVAQTDEKGNPQVRAFLFLPHEITLKKNWSSMGMVATASHSFSVTDQFVSGRRSFVIDSGHVTLPDPVYKFPFLQLAEATLVVNISGMAQRFLDLIKNLVEERMMKQRTPEKGFHAQLQTAQRRFQERRDAFYEALEVAWYLCESGAELPKQMMNTVSMRCRHLYSTSLTEVHALYRYGGLMAADPNTELNRVWRNLHTASQHSLFARR